MRHSDSGHILLELIVEAEACSAYQVVVGERGCKSDQATMVVPRVSVCVVGVAAVVFQMVVEAEVVVGRFGDGALVQLPEAGPRDSGVGVAPGTEWAN
jgi:hypothetical protein